MAVTLRQIAEHTGFSKPTVTRILGKDGHKFSSETRRRVLEAAARMGYRPNAAARAVGRGRFGCAALILGNHAGRSDLPEGLLRGVHDELTTHNTHLTVARLPDEQLTSDAFVPKVLRESMADGMLINYTHDIPQRMLELIRGHHAPAIWLNTKLPTDCVHPDDTGGSARLTEHLLELGHKRIAYVKFDRSTHYSGAQRKEGYVATMAAAGLTPRLVDEAVPMRHQFQVAREVLGGHPGERATAVVVRPEDAPTFACAAIALGLRVPEDVGIASVSGYTFSLMGMDVTAAVVPSDGVGRAGVRMLMQKIGGPPADLAPVVVPFEFYAGQTCRPRGFE